MPKITITHKSSPKIFIFFSQRKKKKRRKKAYQVKATQDETEQNGLDEKCISS